MKLRRCPKCRRELPLDAFCRHVLGPDGLRSWCRECVSASRRKRPLVPEGMRRCAKCGEFKPLDAFGKHAGKKDGRRSRCKDCERPVEQVERSRVGAEDRALAERWKLRREELERRVAEAAELTAES